MGGLFCKPGGDWIGDTKVSIGKQLGEGGFAFVYKATDSSGNVYALKRMLCQTDDRKELALRELDILKKFNHKNILSSIDSELRDRPDKGAGTTELLLLLPFAEHGTLQDMLDRERLAKGETALSVFSEKEVWQIFRGICEGVLQFHEAELALRDLKPPNILMFSGNTPKLSDFGSVGAAQLKPESRKEALKLQQMFETTTTVMYRAPECFEITADSEITEAIDVWALGCILYALMFNQSPFETAYKTGNVGLAAMSGNYLFPETEKFSNDLRVRTVSPSISHQPKLMVTRLLSVDPNFRPSVKDILEMIPE